MTKRASIAVLVIGILIATVAILLLSRADSFIIDTVERYGTASIGTPVTVRSVSISLEERRATLAGLSIDNPEGFVEPHVLEIDSVEIEIDVGATDSELLSLSEAVVRNAQLFAELRGESSNLTELLDSIRKNGKGRPPRSENRIMVDRLHISSAQIDLTARGLDSPQTVALEPLTISNIGQKTGGVSYSEAANLILDAVLGATRAAIRQRFEEAARDEVRGRLEDKIMESL